ncbi:MAG: hypothetical protein ACRC92_26975 [Peptostreptococcaceae bacterium]
MSTTTRVKNILNLVFDKASSDGEALNGINMVKAMLAKQNKTFSDIIGKTSIIEKEVGMSSEKAKEYINEIENLKRQLSNKDKEFTRYKNTQEGIIRSKDETISEYKEYNSKLIEEAKNTNKKLLQDDIDKIREPLENEIKNLMNRVNELANGNPYKIHPTVAERMKNGVYYKIWNMVDKEKHSLLKTLIGHAVDEAPLGHENEYGFSPISASNEMSLEFEKEMMSEMAIGEDSDDCDCRDEDVDAFIEETLREHIRKEFVSKMNSPSSSLFSTNLLRGIAAE